MKIVIVDWVDIITQSGWSKKTSRLAPSPCRSIGWLVEKNKDYVLLTGDVEGDTPTPDCEDAHNRRISIPTGCIKKIRTLKA